MRIRQTDDVDTIRELHRLCFASTAYALREDHIEGSTWWTAEESGVSIAFAGAALMPGKDGAFLIRAGVIPSARGCNLQRQLIRVRLKWARAQGAVRAYTYTALSNYPSMRALIAAGFKPYASTQRDDGSFLYFEKALVPLAIREARKHGTGRRQRL